MLLPGYRKITAHLLLCDTCSKGSTRKVSESHYLLDNPLALLHNTTDGFYHVVCLQTLLVARDITRPWLLTGVVNCLPLTALDQNTVDQAKTLP